MSIYVVGTNLPYRDYLQAKSFQDDFRSDISKASRSIIASNEQLQREHISITREQTAAITSGFEELSFGMQSISDGISELNSTFQWGFSEMLMSFGQVNDSLQQLIRISKTPAQTWAYEQFEIARDAFRQDLFEDSLEHVNRAIDGFASNTGYKLEHRFHYLLGTIRLGGFRNTSSDIVSLPESEKAFLSAAKYSRRDQPQESGRAFLAAGWSAYCQGKISEAQQYSQEAIVLHPKLAEAHFQLAKILMHLSSPDTAIPRLKNAIELDRGYSIKAASDGDFQRYDGKVQQLLEKMRQEAKIRALPIISKAENDCAKTEKIRVRDMSLNRLVDINSVKSKVVEAKSAANSNTFFGYLDSIKLSQEANLKVNEVLSIFRTKAEAQTNNKITQTEHELDKAKSWMSISFGILGFLIFLGCLIYSFVAGAEVYNANVMQEKKWSEAKLSYDNRIRQNGYIIVNDKLYKIVRQENGSPGYNPDQWLKNPNEILSKLGLSYDNFPPRDTGSSTFGTWFFWVFWGGVAGMAIPSIIHGIIRQLKISSLESRKSVLLSTREEIGRV